MFTTDASVNTLTVMSMAQEGQQVRTTAGFQYAATQFSYQCFCGNSYGRYGADPTGCTYQCSGNTGEMCGAAGRNSVYKT